MRFKVDDRMLCTPYGIRITPQRYKNHSIECQEGLNMADTNCARLGDISLD